MTKSEFEKKARKILCNQERQLINDFLKCFNLLEVKKKTRVISEHRYLPKSSPVIKHSHKALYSLNQLAKSELYSSQKNTLFSAISSIEDALSWNQKQKTSGRTTKLSLGECTQLELLKMTFSDCFPHLSIKFKPGNIIFQLGEVLLEKDLPNNTDRVIERYWTNQVSE